MWTRTFFGVLLAGLMMVPSVHAADGEFTVVPSTCAPAPASTGYGWSGASVFLPAAGSVVLRCNVTDPADFMNVMDPVWNNIEVTYRDSDNNLGSESRVQVTLLRVGKINGVVFQVGTFDSDLFAGGMLNSTFFFHVFDFTNYAYFLQITLTRTALGGDTRIHRVRLS